MKKMEIEKTKPTFIVSVLKVEHWVALVSMEWMRKIIPSHSKSALVYGIEMYCHRINSFDDFLSKIQLLSLANAKFNSKQSGGMSKYLKSRNFNFLA